MGNTLRYDAGTNWWKTTFTLPPDKNPPQLHATIVENSPPGSSVGTVVFALYRIEQGVLTLAVDDGADKAPESIDSASSRYVVRIVQP